MQKKIIATNGHKRHEKQVKSKKGKVKIKVYSPRRTRRKEDRSQEPGARIQKKIIAAKRLKRHE